MPMWDTFDSDARRSYYKFLRVVYGMTASEAWGRAKHVPRPFPREAPDDHDKVEGWEEDEE